MLGKENRIQKRVDGLEHELDNIRDTTLSIAEKALDDTDTIKKSQLERDSLRELLREYEIWYNSALPLIEEHLAERADEFNTGYRKFTSLIDMYNMNGKDISVFEKRVLEYTDFQLNLLISIPDKIKSEKIRLRRTISNTITSEEIQRSRELFNNGNIRAAGVLGGVALERHLLTLCENCNKNLDFGYMDGISSLAHTLNDGGEITDDDQRLLDYLAGIRNNCSHANDKEPKESEVERLLSESERFIREN